MWCILPFTVNSQKGESAEQGYWKSANNITKSCDGLEKTFPQTPIPSHSQERCYCRCRKMPWIGHDANLITVSWNVPPAGGQMSVVGRS